jgi:threonylcarbamoyladenosine tRNA methylthiotransferase MtaB
MKIFLDTIGCRLNQAEIETISLQFRAAGHEIVASPAEADLAVVNTCTVTAEAASDSRAAIRRANRLGAEAIVVTGCWSTLEPDRAAALAGVTRIVPNTLKDHLAADLLGLPQEFFDLEPLARQPLPGLHQRTRAFIKVQDGCDNGCTFCITTLARGPSHSRTLEQVIADVNSALDGDAKEIVLTGVHLGSWGHDFQPARRLADLVSSLLSQTQPARLRLSSLEPWDLDADFFSLWQDVRLCRHLHLPLQSGSAGVLRRMARRITLEAFSALVESARAAIPQVAISTDIIVGFPGETAVEFEETLDFVRRMDFASGHVFSYSSRPGTPAARMRGQVRRDAVKARSASLRALLMAQAGTFHRKSIGLTLPVLWEAASILTEAGWQIEGLTDNYQRVTAIAREPRWNRMDCVLIKTASPEGLTGEILE